MKRICLILVVFLLFGCTQSTQPLQERLKNEFDFVNTLDTFEGDNRKEFYSYYIEPSVGRRSSNPSNNIFLKDGVQFVMNLNVSKIISQKYYKDALTTQDIVNESNLLFQFEGKYNDYDLNNFDYQCDVYHVDDLYILLLKTQFMNFYTIGNENEVVNVAGEMMKISRTIKVHPEKIVSAYSSKEAIEYKKEALNLFEVSVPENGRVDEMISEVTNVTNGSSGSFTGEEFYQTDNYGSEVPPPTDTPVPDQNDETDIVE